MAVPKRKVSPSRRNMRRSHDKLKAINVTFDKTTGEPKLPHRASLNDGYYNGRQIYVTRMQKRLMRAEAEATEAEAQAGVEEGKLDADKE